MVALLSMAHTEDDVREQLRMVFDLCDHDKNGFISIDQLVELGKQHFGRTHEDVTSLLHLLDPGGVGFIRFEEFCKGVLSIMHLQQDLQNPNKDICDDSDSLSVGALEPSADQGSYTTYNEYDMADDDYLSSQDVRHSPESFSRGPSASESGLGSPDYSRKNILSLSDGEEKYECYGEQEYETEDGSSPHNIPKRSNSSVSCKSGHPSNQTFQKRNTWLRTSLRRSPGEKKRLSSIAQANHLYQSSGYNSSRRSSSCESDDMIGDLSLEDDVLEINHKVQLLQQQVDVLLTNQNSNEEKYSKVKQENASLMARVHSLEEQIRDVEIRSEQRLIEEQKRLKEMMAKQDREKNLELETYRIHLQNLEKENHSLKEEIMKLKSQLDKVKMEKHQLQDQLSETEYSLCNVQEENKKLQDLARREREEVTQERSTNTHLLEELTKELQELRRYKSENESFSRARSPSMLELPSRYTEMEQQARLLKEENKSLKESNEELQAQLLTCSIQEGRNLLHSGTERSLAAEFETMSKDEIMEALREQQEVNTKLKSYIDGILLSILENYPSILEVKK